MNSNDLRTTSRWLPLRFALRELRAGVRGFYVFIACIALGSMAIAGVGSLAASLADGLAREGQVILGGDLAFTLIQREATSHERTFLENHGKTSTIATMRAMARITDGEATLVLDTQEVKMAAGDVAILRGANHAWSNRSTRPARVAIASHAAAQ